MAETLYSDAAFVSRLPGHAIDVPLLRTLLGELTLSTSVMDVRRVDAPPGVVVEWEFTPSGTDIERVDEVVAAFEGVLTTTSAPFVFESSEVTTCTSETPEVKLNETTAALDEGRWQVSWMSSLRMQATIVDTGIEAKIRLTRSDGTFVEQDDAWDRSNRHAYNGSMPPFEITSGQTITALLTFSRLGASGTAEMSGARVTIAKVG